ncbi:MAG TPA: DNA polymerase III subunit alpha [Methylomirabilota bacterium]|nr:DNA polymerase III subunit alpha [Methylomirabilota bacterium]
MKHSDFVHLHVHSEYSLLDGAARLEKLVDRAKALKFPALALTDHGNLFGAVDFYTACEKAGVKPILGSELYVAPGSRFERSSQDGGYEGASHCTVLARTRAGYANLMKLVSKAYLEGYYYKPRVDRELLAQHADGLLVLSGCLNSEVSRQLSAGDEAKALQTAGWYQEVFGKDYYFMEVQSHGLEQQVAVTEGTIKIARAIGAPLCGTNDSHYLEAEHSKAHEALLCIQTGTTMSDPERWKFSSDEFYVKSADEMRAVFKDLPEAYRNTLAVAERCNVDLQFGQFHLPKYQVPDGFTLDSYLEERALEGLKWRYGGSPSDAVVERLRYELGVVSKMGFSGYFLVVWDFISYARRQGIAVGPGRGSSAGSLVAYCLGITNVDPIRYGLIFERFLNPERISMPDMDIDFADDRRDEVIRYVVDRYGADRVAHIITFGTMGAKAVIRDVARVLGFSYGEADRIAKLVPGFPLNISLDEALEKAPPLAEQVKRDQRVGEMWGVARALEGCTRHASVHASAVVISDEPLMERVPLYKDPKRPELITGYAMGPIEKLGLLKMDFLGLKTLTVISDALRLLKESRGVELDGDALPLDDAKTYQLLTEARTFGVFQLESAGMRDALKRLKPQRIEDIIAMVALYRPGPMDLIEDFVNRKHGRAAIAYEHPLMEQVLQETYGIMVYQEQVMRLAADLAGFSLGEADTLRKAMGKKDRELMATQREKFISGCKANKIDAKKAERIWDLIEKFAGYGFNKCLTADTRIEMADGSQKPITEVRAGDLVLTKDGPYRARAVRSSGVRPVGRLRLANGMTVRCTPDHPIFTQRGWVNAEELRRDDSVAVLRRLAPRESDDVLPPEVYGEVLQEGILKAYATLEAGCRALRIPWRRDMRRGALVRLAEQLDSPALYALAESPIGWSLPRGFVLEGEEVTYDFEVPGAASFIANGIAVHNSHAACYGVVAYQTAYLKANHPTEFMAALLTSEMEKTDKIVLYVEETRAMGLRVEPPDVNVSRSDFTVAGDAIHFGLAAIKNVGATAIESIVRTREADGRFATLEDFCARVDLRLVNRRVVECLIKAGAFDSLQSTRAGLLAALDQAMESGQRQQRDREEGQVSLFDMPGGGGAKPAAPVAAAARVAEWPQEEMLAYEREVLGFYLSGHPLEQYREMARRIGALSAADLAVRSTGARVLLLGQVSAFSESTTKSGNRMAFATLELVDGSTPLTIFPEPYRSCAGALRHKGPVIVRGRADDSDKGRVVLAEEIKPLEEAMGNLAPAGNGHGTGNGAGNGNGAAAHACRIRVSAAAESLPELLASVKAACREHEGRTPLFLHVLLPEQEVVLRIKELAVDPAADLVTKVEGLLGAGSILVEYAGRA